MHREFVAVALMSVADDLVLVTSLRSEKCSRTSEEGQKATQPRKLAHGVNFTHLFEGVVIDAHVRLVAATDVRVPIAAQVDVPAAATATATAVAPLDVPGAHESV